jgi:hypothetical protein
VGANYNFRQKVESKEDRPHKEVVDVAVADFESASEKTDFTLSDEERSAGKVISIGKGKDSTAQMARVMMEAIAPKYQPVATEEEILIDLPTSSHNLKGIIDVRTDKKVVEIKTGNRAWTQARVETEFQLDFYELGYRSQLGEDPQEVVVENLVQKASGITPVAIPRRGRADHGAAIARINRVLQGIALGSYMPAPTGSWYCSPKYCGYYNTCKLVKK